MRKVIVSDWMSLDGVVQSPAYVDEDPSNGFRHGGWHRPYWEDVAMDWVTQGVRGAGGFLLGRRTYDAFAAYWPTAPEDAQALAEPLNTLPKYVASRTLDAPSWQNTRLLGPDVASAVTELKREDGRDLLVFGSTELVRELLAHDLVDEFRLLIDPLLLGGGKRAFHDDGRCRPLRLLESQITGTGVIIARYAVERA